MLLKPHSESHSTAWYMWPLEAFFRVFNWSFDKLSHGYAWFVGRIVRIAVVMLLIYAGVIAFGMNEFRKTPIGFIPAVDGGYLITVTQLPPAASLARTDEVNRRVVELALQTPGVAHAVNLVGFSGATRTNAPNAGAVFVVLKHFEERAKDPKQSAQAIQTGFVRQVLDHSRRADLRRRAASGARHRQRRRFPHDGSGPRGARARPRCSRWSAR